jgi:hypothetical protein
MGAKNAQSLYRKNSVSALARDLIMQYPVLMSADIDYATGVTLTKALEMQFATLQLMVLSADTAFGVDPMKNAGVRDLLSQYHSNADVPNMVNYAGNLMSNVAGAAKHFGIESAQSDDTITSVKVNKAVESSKGVTADFVKSLWEYDSEGLIMESVNDMYNPGKSIVNTIASIADGVEKRVAAEASKYDDYDAINVNKVSDIPYDYFGKMGVPITYLDKYNPEQFDILGLDRYIADNPRFGHRFKINGKEIYARIIIRRKQ